MSENNIMTPEEFKNRMIELQEMHHQSPSIFHEEADNLMSTLLESLGYGEGVEIFDNATKWYD